MLLPPDHGDALSTQRPIALLHMDMERPDLARLVFERLLDVHRRDQDPGSAIVLQGMEDLARCLGALGRVEEQRELVLELTHELEGLEEEEAEQRAELEVLRSELDA